MKNFQQLKKLTLTLFLAMAAGFVFAQAQWVYTSPADGAQYTTAEHNIVIRSSETLSPESLSNDIIEVEGSISGKHNTRFVLANDGRTVIFHTDRDFAYNETIQVTISRPAETINGITVEPMEFSFRTMKEDNSYLRAEYEKYVLKNRRSEARQAEPRGDVPEFKSVKNDNLPDDFPEFQVTINKNPSPGYVFLTPNNPFAPPTETSYLLMLDRFGTPVYYQKRAGLAADLKIQPSGHITHFSPELSGGLGVVYGYHLAYDNFMSVVDTFRMQNGHLAEVHDFLLFENGHSVMFTYDPQIIDMSEIVEGGDEAATVLGFIMQELDADKNVVFEWSSWDHIPITDAVPDIDLTAVFIDYVHGNSVELDNDGNYIISFRHTDEIIKVSRETGEVMWRLNANSDELNDFTFLNDTIKFSHQHDARRLENGNISIFDNGNLHWGPYSRAVEYTLDEVNMTAEQVWSFPAEPGHHDFAFAMGGAQRLADNNTMIGWGIAFYPMEIASEVTANHEKTWEIWADFADTLRTYRGYKFDWTTDMFSLSKDTIDYGEFTGYTPEPYILQVTNDYSGPITISGTYNRMSAFTVAGGTPATIQPGETANVTINFFPSGQRQYHDLLTLYCDLDENSKIAKQVVLKGWTADETVPTFTVTPENESEEVSRMPVITFKTNEKLYNMDGEELSQDDLAGLVSFSEMVTKEEIPFFAEITWMETTETRIEIKPVDSLQREVWYQVSLAGNLLQDWAGNVVADNVVTTFETENFAGIFENNVLSLEAFPNPATDIVKINLPAEGLKVIEMFDLSGRCLGNTETNEQVLEINLKGLQQGIYFVKAKFEDGRTGTSKIIKE